MGAEMLKRAAATATIEEVEGILMAILERDVR